MKKLIAVSSLALVAGVAIGYAFAPKAPEKPDSGQSESVQVQTPKRQRLARRAAQASRMEHMPEAKKIEAESAKEEPVSSNEQARRGVWLENLKKGNPERYVQVTNAMARWRETRVATVQKRLDFLASIDTASMSKAEKIAHERLQKLILEREEIVSTLENQSENAQISNDERGNLMRHMREVSREINDLNVIERENLIKRTAEAVGFSGEEVGEIASTIKEIIEATENGFGHRRPMGSPRGERREEP